MNSVTRQFTHDIAISFMNIMDDIRGVFGGFVEGQHRNKFYSKGSLNRLKMYNIQTRSIKGIT